MTKKITIAASIATIIGVIFSITSYAGKDNHNTINGNHNINADTINGDINIQHQQAPKTGSTIVLDNKGSSALVTSEPSIKNIADTSTHVCLAHSGTPISVTGKKASHGPIQFRQVKILSGECKGRVGWASHSVIAYR